MKNRSTLWAAGSRTLQKISHMSSLEEVTQDALEEKGEKNPKKKKSLTHANEKRKKEPVAL